MWLTRGGVYDAGRRTEVHDGISSFFLLLYVHTLQYLYARYHRSILHFSSLPLVLVYNHNLALVNPSTPPPPQPQSTTTPSPNATS